MGAAASHTQGGGRVQGTAATCAVAEVLALSDAGIRDKGGGLFHVGGGRMCGKACDGADAVGRIATSQSYGAPGDDVVVGGVIGAARGRRWPATTRRIRRSSTAMRPCRSCTGTASVGGVLRSSASGSNGTPAIASSSSAARVKECSRFLRMCATRLPLPHRSLLVVRWRPELFSRERLGTRVRAVPARSLFRMTKLPIPLTALLLLRRMRGRASGTGAQRAASVSPPTHTHGDAGAHHNLRELRHSQPTTGRQRQR